MKKTFVFAIVALTAIIIAASFNIHFGELKTVSVPESMLANALYVCPASGGFWQSIADGLQPFHRYILILFFFVCVVLAFLWGWGLYQNLLSDKFDKKNFTTPWSFTKFTFWAGVIMLLLIMTPNYFRTVHVIGKSGDYVLCESTDVARGARAVRASAVTH